MEFTYKTELKHLEGTSFEDNSFPTRHIYK